MDMNLAHTRLNAARKLIDKEEFREAYEIIDAHRQALAEDSAEEEQCFTELVALAKEYSEQIDLAADKVIELKKDGAKRMLDEASETGKKVVIAAKELVKVLKKEEKDAK
jgi:hypothetical protein